MLEQLTKALVLCSVCLQRLKKIFLVHSNPINSGIVFALRMTKQHIEPNRSRNGHITFVDLQRMQNRHKEAQALG